MCIGTYRNAWLKQSMKKDKEILEEVLAHLRTMRDTWKEVMKLAHSK